MGQILFFYKKLSRWIGFQSVSMTWMLLTKNIYVRSAGRPHRKVQPIGLLQKGSALILRLWCINQWCNYSQGTTSESFIFSNMSCIYQWSVHSVIYCPKIPIFNISLSKEKNTSYLYYVTAVQGKKNLTLMGALDLMWLKSHLNR